MNIHFNHSEPVEAPAETLFDVITDYASYPSFNSALITVVLVARDDAGAEFLADRKTKIGKRAGERECRAKRRRLHRRQPVDPVEHPWQQLVQPREGQFGLRLDPARAAHVESLRALNRIFKERRFPNAGLVPDGRAAG